MSKIMTRFIWGVVMLVALAVPAEAATPVHINFDNLSAGTTVDYEYGPQILFSSENMNVYPTFAHNYCGYCVTSSPPNYVTSGVGYGNGNHEVILTFNQPVKNLSLALM